MLIFLMLIIIIILLCLPRKSASAEPSKDLAKSVLKSVKNYDPDRVQKYLEVKSGISSTKEKMIKKIAEDKGIKNSEEFIERLKLGPFTFMTANQQFEMIKDVI